MEPYQNKRANWTKGADLEHLSAAIAAAIACILGYVALHGDLLA